MKLRKKQKCAAVVLVCCILFQTTYYCVVRPNVVYATGAIGGAAAGAAGGAAFLTGPETALVIAGLFGVTYTIEHADDLYKTMKAAGNAAVSAAGAAAGAATDAAAVVEDWWKAAAAGVVDTTSSVWSGICDWFSEERAVIRSAPHVVADSTGIRYNLRNNDVYVDSNVSGVMAVPFFITGKESEKYTQLIVGVFYASKDIIRGHNGSFEFSSYPTPLYGLNYVSQSVTQSISSSDSVDEWLLKLSNGNISSFGDLSFLYTYPFDYSKINEYCLQKCVAFFNAEKENSITGGIDKALDVTNIDDINFPDTITLSRQAIDELADSVADSVAKAIDNLATGAWTWTEYLEKIASGTQVGAKTAEGLYVLDDAGITTIPLDRTKEDSKADSDVDSAGMKDSLSDYKTDGLTSLFPFCIPFDLINCIKLMSATGEAPCWEFPFQVPVLGLEDTIKIDLAKWDSVAAVCRSLETLLFIGLLISKTRTLIRG